MNADQLKRTAYLLRKCAVELRLSHSLPPRFSSTTMEYEVRADYAELVTLANGIDAIANDISRRDDLYDELVEALESTYSALHNVLGRRAVHDADEILLRSSSVLAKCKGEKA